MALGMTVRELDSRMEHSELVEWMAYFSMEPFGEQQADLRAGVICSVIAKTMGGSDIAPTKFFPIYEERNNAPKKDPYHALNMMKRLANG